MSDGDWPFHTADVDGETVVGVLFCARNGQFYEFQDPGTHDDHARFVDPKHGDVISYASPLDKAVKSSVGAHIFEKLPAERWDEFRGTYHDASDADQQRWADAWGEIAEHGVREPVEA